MITKPLFRTTFQKASYIFVFLWTAYSSFAQCPTIAVSNPPPICDASGYTFANLSADYVVDNGGGIVWYATSTGGSSINPSQLVKEATYFADNSSGSCGSRASIVVDFQVNPTGQNLDKVYCSNDNATIQTYIDDLLASLPFGLIIDAKVYNNQSLTSQAINTELIPNGFKNYFIVFNDNLGCEGQIEFGRTGVFSSPADPTPVSSQMFCADSNPTVASLDPGTASTNFNWYDNIDINGDPVQPALSLSTPLVDGNTYYIQVDNGCVSNPIPVTVTIDISVQPGTPGTLDYCNDSLPNNINLFDELGGPKDTTGSWSGPLATTNGHLGTVNISTLTTAGNYVFTYTVPSLGACPDGVATVTIRVYQTFSSGTISAANPATFCVVNLPTSFDLFSLLDNEDLGGQWMQGATVISNPATIDLTSLTASGSPYDFTYTQNLSPNPCPDQSTTVQVVVLPNPNAGTAVNQTFCENDLAANSPFNLFDALDGSQDNNSGTWRDASNATISNSLDLTSLNVTGSPYSYNYTIDNGSCSDTEIITITVEDAPESGTANAPIAFCQGLAPSSYNLFDLLTGEDQTGTWYSGLDNLGATVANPIDLSGLTFGDYNFTFDVDAIGSCDDVLVTVTVTINPLPNTGTPAAAIFCENDLMANSPLDLFAQLTGEDAGGTWTDDNTSGALTGSNVNLNSLTIGSYNFTYSITDAKGCTNSSTVVVTVEDAPESGTVNTPIKFCVATVTAGQTYNLFDLLTGEDQTGVWNDDDASGVLSGNLATLYGLGMGTYNFTYDVNAIGSCDDVLVTVTIIINDTPAPTASATQEFCDTATVSNLVATGTTIQWYDTATGGTVLTGTTALINGEDYFATQTDATTGCESSVRTSVTAIIYQSPKPGNANTTAIVACNTNNAIDLFTGLDGTQDSGGVWNNDDSVGTLIGNIFDATGVIAGTYEFTYLVTASSPCIDDSITITITIEEPLNAGTNNVLDVCSNNGTTDLFTLIGSAGAGGSWSPAMASGTGVFNPLVDASATYKYTLTNACGTVSSDVVVTVTLAPNAGTNNTAAICVIDGQTDLFPFLGTAAQSGGTWSPSLTSGTGVFDPNVDTAQVYTYTVTAVSPCPPNSSAEITVTISDSPAPVVVDATPSFCLVNNPTVADLGSSITATGTVTWYSDAALTTSLNASDALIDGQDYYATNNTGCESSANVQITVTINDAPMPTLKDSSLEYCINDGPTISTLTDNIEEHDSVLDNVIWYDSATNGNTISSSTSLTNLTTYYVALVDATTGCESSVRLAVTPDLTSCGVLRLPDGFSPNGDGVNDTFEVDNLAILYPNFEIEIYNRYGSIVYKGNASTPRFDGKSNQSRTTVKGDLPVGMYYYIFNFNDDENKPKQGHLYLSR